MYNSHSRSRRALTYHNRPRPLCAACTLVFLLLSASSYAQRGVAYDISFPNALHHEAEVVVTFSGVPAGRPLEVRISRSSPGRYAVQEFARNVYNVRATDGAGAALTVTHPSAFQWNITGITARSARVRVAYTLFADLASGTYSGVDRTMVHLSMPATFVWARGMEYAPVNVRFHRPSPAWTIATQLVPTADPEVFTAPHMQYFMDSPTLMGALRVREWPIQSNRRTYTIRLAVNDTCADQVLDDFTEMVKKAVAEEVAIFGEAPDYDFGLYTFIANDAPQVGDDGMEHRNSTSMTSTQSLKDGSRAMLDTAAHEFFHAWNVERLRPRSLEPFNFEDANISGDLWMAEGFTKYYGNLVTRRAGFLDDAGYGRLLGAAISDVLNAPGRLTRGPLEMSQLAVFEDGGAAAAWANSRNRYLDYYTYGSAVAMGLDLTLRTRFPGKTLDGYMRELWQSYGRFQKNYNPAKPYTLADLRGALAKVTNDAAFANDYFARYVEGRETVDYEGLLAKVGLHLRKQNPGQVWLDTAMRERSGAVFIAAPTATNGPLYRAGLDRGDRIVALAGQPMKTLVEVRAVFGRLKPGEVIAVEVEQRGEKRTVNVTCVEDPQMEVVTYESLNKEVTAEMKQLRTEWLGGRAGRVSGGDSSRGAGVARSTPRAPGGETEPSAINHGWLGRTDSRAVLLVGK